LARPVTEGPLDRRWPLPRRCGPSPRAAPAVSCIPLPLKTNDRSAWISQTHANHSPLRAHPGRLAREEHCVARSALSHAIGCEEVRQLLYLQAEKFVGLGRRVKWQPRRVGRVGLGALTCCARRIRPRKQWVAPFSPFSHFHHFQTPVAWDQCPERPSKVRSHGRDSTDGLTGRTDGTDGRDNGPILRGGFVISENCSRAAALRQLRQLRQSRHKPALRRRAAFCYHPAL